MELTRYLDNAIASIILYQKYFGINNWLCEPNRLYQAVCRQKPVLVGNNPPMSEVVKEYNLGVVLDDDGESVKKFKKGLHCLVKELDSYCTISSSLANQFSWESQEPKIRDLLS